MPELEDLKKIVRSLVVARKGAVPIHVLERDYIELEGEPIPWKRYGNISLLDFLKSIKTHVIVDRINGEWQLREVASEQTRHISSLVARQKSTSKRKLPKFNRRTAYRTSQYYPRTYAPQIQLSADLLGEVVAIVRRNPNGLTKDFILNYVNERSPNITISMKDLIDQMRQVGHEISVGDHKMYPIKRLVENSEQQSQFNRIDTHRDEESQSHSTPSVVFSAAGAESDIGDNTDDEAFICQSFRDQRITFHNSNRSPTHRQNMTNDTDYNTDDDSTHPDPDDVKRLINDRIKYRLEKLIQKYPSGIWCAQLPDLYFEEYKITLTYTELGFNSVREFASQLPEIFVAAQPTENGDYKLYDAKKGIPSRETFAPTNTQNLAALYHDIYQAQQEEPPLPVQVSLDTTRKLIPDNVMAIGETVGQILVADYLKDEYYMEVFVVEVFTPSFFWIIPRKQKKRLDEFMENLHNFYMENSREYQVPVVVLEKGLNVACIYEGHWHRGIIKTVKPDLDVTVLFYDYGTLKTYRPEDIYYLHRRYACIPAQAIPCGLYNVKPCANREKWSQTFTQAFAEKTGCVPLIAMVKKIDEENNSMLVTLTDTTEEEDVHINDWLVGEGMAEFGQLIEAVEMHKIMLYVEENLLYAKEKCYHVEESKNQFTPKSFEKINKPLISPQSILNASLKPPPGINNPPNLLNVSNLLIGNNTFSNIYHPNLSNNHFLVNQSTLPVSSLGTPILRTILQENLQLQKVLKQNMQDLFMKIKSDAAPGHLSSMSQAINVMNTVHQLNVDRKFTADMKNHVPASLSNGTILDENLNQIPLNVDRNIRLRNTSNIDIQKSCLEKTIKFKDTNPFKTMNMSSTNSSKHNNPLIGTTIEDRRSFEYRLASTMTGDKRIDPRYQRQNLSLPDGNHLETIDKTLSVKENQVKMSSQDTSLEILLPSLYTQNTTLVSRTLQRDTTLAVQRDCSNNSLLDTQNGISNGLSCDYKNVINQKNEGNGNQFPSRSDRKIFNQYLVGSPKLRRPQQIEKEKSHSSPNNPFINTNGIHPQSNTQFRARRTIGIDTTSTDLIAEQELQEDSFQQHNHGHRKNFIAFLMTARTLLIYYPIPIFDDIIHVFHYKREGWLSIDEFVTVFTNFTSPTFLLNSLEVLNIHLPGQSIKRSEDRTVFSMLDRTLLGASRDSDGKIVAITLIPLKCVSTVFEKLKSLDCNAKHVWSSRMLKIMTLEKAYKDIQQQIQANELK